jgi:predicted membrane protein
MRFFLRNLELILTLVGLVVVFVVAAIAQAHGVELWHAAAITAVSVGVIHGVLFWLVRRRQRNVRKAAFLEIQAMLSDIINNQLTVMQASRDLAIVTQNQAHELKVFRESIGVISSVLKTLSEDSMRSWKSKYSRE